MQSIEELIEAAIPTEKVARLCLRGDLYDEHETAERELRDAQRRADTTPQEDTLGEESEVRRAARRVLQIEDEMRAAEVEFRFRALPRDEWDALRKPYAIESPNGARLNVDDTGCQIAFLATCVDPTMTAEQAARLHARLNESQRIVLVTAAMEANIGRPDIPFSQRASRVLNPPDSSPS